MSTLQQRQSHCSGDYSSGDNPSFSHVHVDIVVPLLVSAAGYRFLLTMVDRTTRWPEAVPLTDITAETCADSFMYCPLGSTLWRTRYHYHRLRHTVLRSSGGMHVKDLGYVTHHDNLIPPTEQWAWGAVSSEVEGGFAGKTVQLCLVRAPSMGPAWYPVSPQGDFWCIISGSYIRHTSGISRPGTGARRSAGEPTSPNYCSPHTIICGGGNG